jgi:Ala-tRNA(Pro) deacylase
MFKAEVAGGLPAISGGASMPSTKLKQFLDSQSVKYVSIIHSVAYTAQEIASLVHIPGRELAKTVMVFLDDRLAMAVVPASTQVSLSRLKELSGGNTIAIATEREFRDAFPDCETGAMPPFGNLYNVPVYADEGLRSDEIVFNAGTHRELVRMSYADFYRLVSPVVGQFAMKPHEVAAGF